MQELLDLLRLKRKNAREPVSEDDCLRAISKLKVLQAVARTYAFSKKHVNKCVHVLVILWS